MPELERVHARLAKMIKQVLAEWEQGYEPDDEEKYGVPKEPNRLDLP